MGELYINEHDSCNSCHHLGPRILDKASRLDEHILQAIKSTAHLGLHQTVINALSRNTVNRNLR